MRRFLLLLTILWAGIGHSQIQTLLTVGEIPITSFDVEEMRGFMELMSGRPVPAPDALEALLYQTTLISLGTEKPEYNMDEAEFRRNLSLLTNNTSQGGSDQRKEIYEKYPELFRLAIRSDKTKRAIMYGDSKIRGQINVPTSIQEKRAFYEKNKKEMKDSPFPKVNLIIFAVESSDRHTLSQLTEIEDSLAALSKQLNTSSDVAALRKQYPKLRFTKYSGETGLFTPDILVLQKGVPEEIVGVALQKNIPLGTTNIAVVKNRSVYIPAPVPLRSTKIPTYIVFKLLDLIPPRELSFDEASPRIEEILRNERGETAVRDLIRQRIKDGQVTFALSNPGTHRPAIERFISGEISSASAPAKNPAPKKK